MYIIFHDLGFSRFGSWIKSGVFSKTWLVTLMILEVGNTEEGRELRRRPNSSSEIQARFIKTQNMQLCACLISVPSVCGHWQLTEMQHLIGGGLAGGWRWEESLTIRGQPDKPRVSSKYRSSLLKVWKLRRVSCWPMRPVACRGCWMPAGPTRFLDALEFILNKFLKNILYSYRKISDPLFLVVHQKFSNSSPKISDDLF